MDYTVKPGIITINSRDYVFDGERLIPTISGGRNVDPRRSYQDDQDDPRMRQAPRNQQRQPQPPQYTDEDVDDGEGEDDLPPEDRTYSKQEFDRHMAGMRRKYETEIGDLRGQIEELSGGFNELLGALEEAVGDDDGEEYAEDEGEEEFEDPRQQQQDSRSSDEVAYLNSQMRKMAKQMEAMQSRLQEEQDAREEELIRRLETERDSLISKALTENKVVSVDGGLKIFRDLCEYDPDKERWVFVEPETGAKLDLLEGIRDNIPDWLKESSVKRGGSGGRGSQQAQLQAQKQNKLGELEKAAKQDPTPANIAAYHSYKKQMQADTGQVAVRQGGQGPQTTRTQNPMVQEPAFDDA